jgi:predicted glycoside hydrolase/deacetylase ChbG (UPF0249 family)
MSAKGQTNQLLGYSADARLLIINMDDFGMGQAINQATLDTFKNGLGASCTLMVPCPWALHGMHLLQENPDLPFGVHLTVVSENLYYRWGPLNAPEKVPSLVDEKGYFYSEARIPEFLSQVNLAELEQEFRTQIETVLAEGLQPTHLDSHCGIHTRREDIFDLTVQLAREYGLALRASEQPLIEKLQQQSYAANDYNILDSYDLDTAAKPTLYPKLLRELPAGLSEWAIHPGLGNAELQAMSPSWPVRQADYDFFTSPEARAIVEQEGIILLNYKPLQQLWQAKF